MVSEGFKIGEIVHVAGRDRRCMVVAIEPEGWIYVSWRPAPGDAPTEGLAHASTLRSARDQTPLA